MPTPTYDDHVDRFEAYPDAELIYELLAARVLVTGDADRLLPTHEAETLRCEWAYCDGAVNAALARFVPPAVLRDALALWDGEREPLWPPEIPDAPPPWL